MSAEPDYVNLVEFDTDDPEFTRGVQVGMLWHRLYTDPLPFTGMVYATNTEMMMRIAEARGCKVQSDYCDEQWASVTFSEE